MSSSQSTIEDDDYPLLKLQDSDEEEGDSESARESKFSTERKPSGASEERRLPAKLPSFKDSESNSSSQQAIPRHPECRGPVRLTRTVADQRRSFPYPKHQSGGMKYWPSQRRLCPPLVFPPPISRPPSFFSRSAIDPHLLTPPPTPSYSTRPNLPPPPSLPPPSPASIPIRYFPPPPPSHAPDGAAPSMRAGLTHEERERRLFLASIAELHPDCSWREIVEASNIHIDVLRERCKSGSSRIGPKKIMMRYLLQLRSQ